MVKTGNDDNYFFLFVAPEPVEGFIFEYGFPARVLFVPGVVAIEENVDGIVGIFQVPGINVEYVWVVLFVLKNEGDPVDPEALVFIVRQRCLRITLWCYCVVLCGKSQYI